jgi:hypothetical protein
MYEVTPRNVIGIIELSNKILVIRPKISIKNILFLLCYSWEPNEWKYEIVLSFLRKLFQSEL